MISGYEFGEFLRILLWIGVPATILFTLVTTWLHYRRRQKLAEQLVLSMEGMEGREKGSHLSTEPESSGDGRVDTERSVIEGEDEYKENLYRGILWMKEKYEQYRDLADERYDRLKEQLTRVEKRYEDLLASVQQGKPMTPAPAQLTEDQGMTDTVVPMEERWERQESPAVPAEFRTREFTGESEIIVERAEAGPDRIRVQELEEQLARTQQRLDEEVGRLRYQLEEETARGRRLQDEKSAVTEANRLLEQQALHNGRLLEEKLRYIADLEGQLSTDRVKIEELVTKLRNNSQLLMNIYQELDKSLHFSDTPPQG